MPAWRTSDTSIAGAVEALRGVQAVSRHFHGFDDYEVRVLAKAMSMVEFHEGDSIIEKGETASWFGVLLSGTVHAVIAPDLRFPIHRGEILGEQSLFSQPSTRSASVVGATAGMMGLFTFDELAAFVQDAPALGLRLVSLLGHASAEKLDAERAIAVRDARPAPMAPAWKQLKQPTELLRLFTEVAGRSRDLSTLSAADCEALFSVGHVLPFAAGEELVGAGQEVPFAAVVLSGEVRVADRLLRPGETLCERRLLEAGSLAQPERVVGHTDGTLLTFGREVLLDDVDGGANGAGSGARITTSGVGSSAASASMSAGAPPPGAGGAERSNGLARWAPALVYKIMVAFTQASLREARSDIQSIRAAGKGAKGDGSPPLATAATPAPAATMAEKEPGPKKGQKGASAPNEAAAGGKDGKDGKDSKDKIGSVGASGKEGGGGKVSGGGKEGGGGGKESVAAKKSAEVFLRSECTSKTCATRRRRRGALLSWRTCRARRKRWRHGSRSC
jgi:CRP-like cAMP-binding protein